MTSPVTIPGWDAGIRHGKVFINVVGMTFVLLTSGNRLIRLSSISFQNIFEEFTLSFAIGYGAWGSLLFLLGLIGFWSPNFLRLLLVISCVLGLPDAIRLCSRVLPAIADAAKSSTLSERLLASGFIVAVLTSLRLTSAPETFYDALQYHLALPSLYLANERIIPTPENSYSGIPALPQMLYGWTLAVDQWGITAAAFHSSLSVWIGLSLIAIFRRMGHSFGGIMAASAFFLTPVVLGESYRTSVGLEWALMELCCFNALLAGLELPFGALDRKKWFALTGIFLGLAMGTKYPAWLVPIALIPALFIGPSRQEAGAPATSKLSARDFLFISSVAALIVAPWIAKNIWFYHNPIFPFFHEFFVRQSEFVPDWRKISSAGTDIRQLLTIGGLAHYMTFPLRFLNPPEGIGHSIGLFSICLLPVLFLQRLTGKERFLAWFCLFLWVPLSILSPLTRFFIPHLSLLTLLICSIIVRTRPQRTQTILIVTASLLCLTSGLNWAVLITSDRERLAVFHGTQNYNDYLAHARTSYPTPTYAGIQYINQEAPSSSRVLFYGDSRSFHLKRRYLATSDDQIPAIEVWANGSANAEELKRRVDQEGIGYILMNLGEIARLQQQPQTSQRGISNLATFWSRYTHRVFGVKDHPDRWVGVYKVLSLAESTKPHATDDLFSRYISQSPPTGKIQNEPPQTPQ